MMRSLRRSSRPMTVLALMAVALAGCAGVSDPTPTSPSGASTGPAVPPITAKDPKAPVTLTFWTGQASDAQTLLEKKTKEFTALHPNVTIKASSGAPTTDDLLQKLSASFAAGTYPDISYAYGSWASELAASGRTLDISGNVADPSMAWEEIPTAARETASPGGKTIGVPALVDNLALFYNKTVFDNAGLPYPDETMTWPQFREIAKKLTDPSKNIFGTAFDVTGGEGSTWAIWPQLWQNGGRILSEDEKTAEFNSQAGIDAVQFWRDLTLVDKSVYLDQTAEKAAPLFYSNNIGMLMTGPWVLFDLGEQKTRYGVTVLPGTNGDHQTVSGPDLWVLYDHEDANRAYWSFEFIKWLTSAEQDLTWNVEFGNLPLRTTEQNTPEFAAKVKEFPAYAVLTKNLENAKQKRPTVQGYVGLSKAFGDAVSKILQGQLETKAGLDDAKVKADRALADQ